MEPPVADRTCRASSDNSPARDLGRSEMLALIHAQQQQLAALTAQLEALAAEWRRDDHQVLPVTQLGACRLPPVEEEEEEEEESDREPAGARVPDGIIELSVRANAFTPLGVDLGWPERVRVHAGTVPQQCRVWRMRQNDSPYQPPATVPVQRQRAYVNVVSNEEEASSNKELEEEAPPRRQQRQQPQQPQGIPSHEQCSIALQLMDGVAKKIINSDNDLFFTQSWATCSAIMANYFKEDNEVKALSSLYSLEMGKNESMMEFVPRFHVVIPGNYTEHQRIQAFISKLPVNLQHSLNLRQPTTFSQAVQIAKELEAPLRNTKHKVIGALMAPTDGSQGGNSAQEDKDFLGHTKEQRQIVG
ncbi:hypothetical protein QOT17_020381 [Balamuthia mandrillaris]